MTDALHLDYDVATLAEALAQGERDAAKFYGDTPHRLQVLTARPRVRIQPTGEILSFEVEMVYELFTN